MAADYTLSAEIVPELAKDFARQVQSQIKAAMSKVDASAKIKAAVDSAQLQREVSRAAREAKATIKVKVEASVSATQLQREMNRAAREAKLTVAVKAAADFKNLKIKADLDTKLAQARLDNLVARTRSAKIKADLDDANAKLKIAKIADIQRKIEFKAKLNDKSKEEFENEVSALAKRANFRFNAIALGVGFAGLPAAAIIAGAGVVAGLSLVPAAFAAIGTAAVASSAQVRSSFSAARAQIAHDTQQISQPLIGTVVDSIDRVKAKFSELKPTIATAIQGSAPALTILTDSVLGFATRAMPGFIVAINNSITPMRGLRDLFYSLGSGLTDFFGELSRGAAGSETILHTIGTLVQDLLGFAGKLFANLSNNGNPVLLQFKAALDQVERALLTLTSAGSFLYSAMSGVTSAISGGLGAFQGLLGILDMLPAGVSKFGGELLLTSRLLNAFGVDITSGFNGLGAKIQEAEGFSRKLTTGLKGLAFGAFGPVGLAAGALTIGLGLLGDAQQKAAQKAAEHKAQQDSFREALAATNGVVDESIRKSVAKKAEERGALENTRVLGLGQKELIDALTGGAAAADKYTNALSGTATQLVDTGGVGGQLRSQFLEIQKQFVATGGSAADASVLLDRMAGAVQTNYENQGKSVPDAIRLSDAWKVQATRVLDLSGQYNQLGGDFKGAQVDQKNLGIAVDGTASATQHLSYSQLLAQQSSKDLASNFTNLGDTADTAKDKAKDLMAILDQLNGRVPSYEEAQQSLNDQVRALVDNFDNVKGHADGFGKALLNADGTVNTATKNGSFLQNTLTAMEKGFVDSGVAIDALVKSGVPLDKATKQVNDDLAIQRKRFIDAHDSMGLTAAQATELADKYGLIPSEVTTTFVLAGTTTAQDALTVLKDQITGIPTTHEVKFTTLNAEAEQKLTALGFQVTHMPNGTVTVTANTDDAKAGLGIYLATVGTSSATTTVFGNTAPALGAVKHWKDTAQSTEGTTTTYSYTDPATQAVTKWTFDTNSKKALTTTYTNTDPATGQVNTFIRLNDGRVVTLQAAMQFSPTADDASRAAWDMVFLQGSARGTVHGRPELGGIAATKADGGWVFGPGSSTSDSIPARLSNGEFVMRASQAARFGPVLEQMNSGRFATGGWVGYAAGGTVSAGAGGSAPSVGSAAPFVLPAPALLAAVQAALDLLNAAVAAYNTAVQAASAQSPEMAAGLSALATTITSVLVPALGVLTNAQADLRADEQATAAWSAQQWNAIATYTANSVSRQLVTHENLKNSLAVVRTAFTDTANWSNAEFGRAYSAAADPIRRVINGPIHGLVDAWNSLDGQFSFGQHINAPAANFAYGGPVSGPGTGTSDSIPAWLSNGEYVMPADATQRYKPVLDQMRVQRFAAGGLVGDFTGGAFDQIDPQISAITNQFPGNVAANAGAAEARRGVEKTKAHFSDKMSSFVATGGSAGGYGAGVQQWAPLVLQALAMLGQSPALLPNVLRRMNQESGGNPTIGNFWDSNAAKGTPSMGLMQVIGPTFAAYAGQFRNLGILNPFANIFAGLNYALHAYPSLQYAMDKPGGYHEGGEVPGLGFRDTVPAMLTPGEAVLTPKEKYAYQAQAKAAAEGGSQAMRLDQHSINRLAAAITAASERRPNVVNVSGIGLTGGGI